MARRKYHKNEDWWGANTYLASEIAWCADQLIKHQKGYPGTFDRKNDRSKIIKYSKANEKKWRKLLIEMRNGFQLYSECDGHFYDWKNGKAPPSGESVDEMLQRVNSSDNPYKTVLNKTKLRKFKRAMELFAKYFDHLWD